MKSFYIKSFLLILIFSSVNILIAKDKNLILKENRKIVFLGNSITEFWPQHTKFFSLNKSYINKGISGQTTVQMLKRFQTDVINQNPYSLIILAGINDIAQNTGPITIEEIANNIIKMSELATEKKINVIICSVLPANNFLWNLSINPTYKVIYLNSLLKKYCKENNIVFVDYYSEMTDWGGGLKTPQYTSKYDLVHPNKKGYEKMEEILFNILK